MKLPMRYRTARS